MTEDGPTPYLFEKFQRLVVETAAWCTGRVRTECPDQCLRSRELDPGVCFNDREPMPWSGETSEFRFLEDVHTVARLAQRRRLALNSLRGHHAHETEERGRVLLFLPGDSLSTQAMHPASQGFFALNGDLPPWDTWVAYLIARRDLLRAAWDRAPRFRLGVLVCWIPDPLVELAHRGLDASETPLGDWVPKDQPLRGIHDDLLRSLGAA